MCLVQFQDHHLPKEQHNILELSKAYEKALKALKKKNETVEERYLLIKEQMQGVVDQMRKLKLNTDEIEERLYQLLHETLALL